MTQAQEPSCEFCNKKGLAVLPVRYTVAAPDSKAPALSAPFKLDPAPDLGRAHYTARLLRSGYLYVYDEARRRWEEYFVTPDSYYFKLPARGPNVIKPTLPKAFACARSGHAPLAACITIRDPKNATQVWFGFSDVEWTDEALKKHGSAAYRARHMQKISVSGGKVAPGTDQMKPISQVDAAVTEYALAAAAGAKDFDAWNPFAYTPRHENATELKQAAERLAPGAGIVLALNDPAGIAQALALLMKYHADKLVSEPQLKYKLAVSGAITQLEDAIKHQAELQEMQAAEELANQQTAESGLALLLPSVRENIEKIRTVTEPELERAARQEWAKYTAKYDEPARAAWQSTFEQQLKKFDAQYIVPLALAHVVWLKSTRMVSNFQCNYDTANADSGAVYTAVFGHCIASTPDKKACFDLYTEWLQGDPTDHANLLLGALTYNQDSPAQAIKEAVANAVDWRGLAWDKLIEAHDKAAGRVLEGRPDVLGRLIGLIAGSIAAKLKEAAQSRHFYAGLVAAGVASRHPIVEVTIEGGKKAFRAMLIRQLVRLNGPPVSPNQMKRTVAAELRRLQIHGVGLEGTQTKRWLLMIDPAQVRNMPAGLTGQDKAQWLARTIRTPEQVEELDLYRFRLQLGRAEGVVRASVPYAFSILGVVTNLVALNSLLDEEHEAMRDEKDEKTKRVYTQAAQLVGATAGTIELALERVSVSSLRLGKGVALTGSRIAGAIGRTLGIGGSLLMGVWDFARGYEEFDQGNKVAGWGFVISGGLGVAATVFLVAGWTGWGALFAIAMFAWAFIMPLLVDNRVQVWLERCLWGKLVDHRYGNLDTEMEQLKAALKA